MTHSLPLAGQTALVTGVSRRKGIGFATATRLLELGASVFVQHFSPHDTAQPWGGDDIEAVLAALESSRTEGARLGSAHADLRAADAPAALVRDAASLTGGLDILVCNHAKSGDDGAILDMTAERLSAMWETNTRATILLTRAFAALVAVPNDAAVPDDAAAPGASASRPGERASDREPFAAPVGRVFWMTSGQGDGPMRGEVAYAASKAALSGITATVAAELLDLGIILNTINPGPVNTGYLDPEGTDRDLTEIDEWRRRTPFGRFGEPADPARLIGWLATDDGAWVVGQVIKSDGGLSLY
ncbi:SDR family oxidoreductase [Demequina muriae]|uniref:SDR family oxidoreductase n=1 Tax=Demequina muriae TaxID=3051664 RepID=A0ABT8GDI6_9MICO|nr:SDR family oxidoreductase [Demequina sp. EGI L300058]MDN4479498.1 SDR family oxidoreductase [Demequina sp. EGI L300058]